MPERRSLFGPTLLAAVLLLAALGPARRGAAACVCDPDMDFSNRAEWTGPLAASASVDVNLGNDPTAFVRAAYWQVNGAEPPAAFVTDQVDRLTNWGYWRRIDTVNTILSDAGSSKARTYSDPWTAEPALTSAPCKNVARDVGAVLMLFFDCPGGVNCGMDWANNHALGMDAPHSLLGFGASPSGYYKAISNAGMLKRELLDARYAGLQFFLPNIYGWDITDGSVDNLVAALADIASTSPASQVKVGMFDDTWGWGNGGRPFPWNQAPDMSNTVAASDYIFNYKWAPYFDKVPSQYWYTVGGKPLIYFYNSGTILHANANNVLARLKTLFNARYGVDPFLAVDIAYWYSSGMAAMGAVADQQFTWRPTTNLANGNSTTYYKNGITLTHSMPRWDPIGRDSGGSTSRVANSGDGVIKGPEYLTNALSASASSDLLVFATWNDLGEGTGINRCFDYYHQGQWLKPTAFMDLIRASQSQQSCPPGSPTHSPTPSASPTVSPTPSATRTASPSPTATPSASPTRTASPSPTDSPTASPSRSVSPSPTDSPTASPTRTASPSTTDSPTASGSPTPGPSATPSASPSATPSASPSPSATPSFTTGPSPSGTPSASPTGTPTATPTGTPTASPSPTASASGTPFTPSPSPTTQEAEGSAKVLQAVPFPQPQGGASLRLRVLLSGPASGFRLRVYTVAMVLALEAERSGSFNGGWNDVIFDGAQDLKPGQYFCRLEPRSSKFGGGESGKAIRLVWIR